MFRFKTKSGVIACFVIGVLILAFWASNVYAQSAPLRAVVTRSDVAQFPQIVLDFAVFDENDNPVNGLGTSQITLMENNKLVSPFAVEQTEMGNDLVFVIDASKTTELVGASKKKRIEEAVATLLEYVNETTPWMRKGIDTATVYVPKDGTSYIVTPKSEDQVGSLAFFNNNVVKFFSETKPVSGATPLFGTLFSAYEYLAQHKRDTSRGYILVFSDGEDSLSNVQLEDITNRAAANNISICAIFLGTTEGKPEKAGVKNLKRLAELTHGRYYWYQSIDTAKGLFQQLDLGRKAYQISYDSTISTSGKQIVSLSVKLADGRSTPQITHEFAVTVDPPKVIIKDLPFGTLIERASQDFVATIDALEPKTRIVTLDFDWRKQAPRTITRVEFSIDGVPQPALTTPPFDSIKLNLEGLAAGQHFLKVTAFDSLGLSDSTEPIPITLTITVPQGRQLLDLAERYGSWLVALAALLFAAIVFRRKPQIVHQIEEKRKEITARWFPQRPLRIKAYLQPRANNDIQILLYGQPVYIGRDPEKANRVINNQYVSNLHARIVEERDNVFYLYDEGSTSGTFINNNSKSMEANEKHQLQDGDSIAFGPVEFVFKSGEPPKDSTSTSDDKKKSESVKNDTERFQGKT